MAMKQSYSTLAQAVSTINHMLETGFSPVTVINAKIYDNINKKYRIVGGEYDTYSDQKVERATQVFFNEMKVDEILALYDRVKPICYLESLKTSTATVDGPQKSVTGGQYNNTLVKFGKTARLEMSDALGNGQALAAMTGAIIEDFDGLNTTSFSAGRVIEQGYNTEVLHFGSNFAGNKTIIGDTFFIDYKTGAQVKLKIIFYCVVPDSTFTLTLDAEGDGTVFDMNGDLQATDILVGINGNDTMVMGNFYSIAPDTWSERKQDITTPTKVVLTDVVTMTTNTETGVITLTKKDGATQTVTVDGEALATTKTIAVGTAAKVVVTDTATGKVLCSEIISV